jgi:urease gamma subunit
LHLSPHEQERLLLSYAAELARRRRRARGLKLNLPEATALVTDHVLEGARDGVLVAALMQSGRTVPRPRRRGAGPLDRDDADRAERAPAGAHHRGTRAG